MSKIGKLFLLLIAGFFCAESQQSRYDQQNAPWFQDISQATLDPQSSEIITWLQNAGGWGGGKIQIDFSINVLTAGQSTPFTAFSPTADFFNPDCDNVPVPLPVSGALEGETGYRCLSDGDCHLLVFYTPTRTLYEMWRADIANNIFHGGCLAVWNLNQAYRPEGRGEQCTSADAAGLPIAPLLFSADEVKAGRINHGIRFILPNSRIRHNTYVHPATHATGVASGGASAPPYGTRLRLRSDFPLSSLPNEAARVVARAMQRYGIFLADGGTIALTAENDSFTTEKWTGLLSPHDLQLLNVGDFQMINGGQRYTFTGDCTRSLPVQTFRAKQNSHPGRIIHDGVGRIRFEDLQSGIRVKIGDLHGRMLVNQEIGSGQNRYTLKTGTYFYSAGNLKGKLVAE